MNIETNETVTIKRGKFSGRTGTVIGKNTVGDDRTVAVQFDDGGLAVVNETNVKLPESATISEGDLAAILATEIEATGNPDSYQSLVHALDAKLPGFAKRVNPAA